MSDNVLKVSFKTSGEKLEQNVKEILRGYPGVSPTVTVTETTVGNIVTITDANGDHSFIVKNGDALTKEELITILGYTPADENDLNDKQDVIDDLKDIREGAEAGKTALQKVPDTYRTAAAQDVIDEGKEDKYPELDLYSKIYTEESVDFEDGTYRITGNDVYAHINGTGNNTGTVIAVSGNVYSIFFEHDDDTGATYINIVEQNMINYAVVKHPYSFNAKTGYVECESRFSAMESIEEIGAAVENKAEQTDLDAEAKTREEADETLSSKIDSATETIGDDPASDELWQTVLNKIEAANEGYSSLVDLCLKLPQDSTGESVLAKLTAGNEILSNILTELEGGLRNVNTD